MQIDSSIHKTDESLKCFIYDYFRNSNSIRTLHPQIFVLIAPHEHAKLFYLNDEHTHITHSIPIQPFSQLNCIVHEIKGDCEYFLYTYKNVIRFRLMKRQDHVEISEGSKKIQVYNEQIVCLSSALALTKYDIVIACTSKGSYYSIIIKPNHQMDIVKMVNKEWTFLFYSFFKQRKSHQYKNMFLHASRIDHLDNFIACICIKDTIIHVELIQLMPESHKIEYKTINHYTQIENYVSSKSALKEVIVSSQTSTQPRCIELILAYQSSLETISIFSLSVHLEKQNIFELSKIAEHIQNNNFQMIVIKNSLIYSYLNKKEDIYYIKKLKIRPTSQRNQEIIKTSVEKHILSKISNNLFINTISNIYRWQCSSSSDSQESDLSQLQMKLLNNKNKIQKEFNNQLEQYLLTFNESKEKIKMILRQKEELFVRILKEELKGQEQNEHNLIILTIEIVKVNTVLYIMQHQYLHLQSYIESNSDNPQVYRDICQKHIHFIMNYLTFIAQTHRSIIYPIIQSVHQNMFHKTLFIEAFKILFNEAIEEVLHYVIENKEDQKQMGRKDVWKLMNMVIAFQIEDISQFIEQLIVKYPNQLKQAIMDNMSHGYFIDTFMKINYSPQDLHSIAYHLSKTNQALFMEFIKKILIKCQKGYSQKNQNILEKINLIIDGFSSFQQQVVPQMKIYFSGILFFYYLKKGERQQGKQLISQLSANVNSQFNSYLISLAIKEPENIQKKSESMQQNSDFQQISHSQSNEDENLINENNLNKKKR